MEAVSGTILTTEPRVVVVKKTSRGGEVVVFRTGVRVVGCRSREELTVTRVTVMGGLVDMVLVLMFSGS
jgi:hypothetical protein